MSKASLSSNRTNRQMKKDIKQNLTLDRPVTYQIRVPGKLDESWSEWYWEMTVMVESDDDNFPITTLIGIFDQAALQGLLRRLYTLGLPLISVVCIDDN
jgi:hypothetical protein